MFFDPDAYAQQVQEAAEYIRSRFPKGFLPKVTLTLGSGGLGEMASAFTKSAIIPYSDIPHFAKTTVVGHAGNIVAGYLSGVPTLGLQGRTHFYELGEQPNAVAAMKRVVFPVYVARALGAEIYMATNAAGGLREDFQPGDIMVLNSHFDLFFPNPLLGPVVPLFDAPRFQPQNGLYSSQLRALFADAARESSSTEHVHEGAYAAVTGPTFESSSDSRALRALHIDAVGMSTVPEIITAANIGMETFAFSLITNVIAEDGTNATSHEEVMVALSAPETKKRILDITTRFFSHIAL